MRRKAFAMVMLATLGGCMSIDTNPGDQGNQASCFHGQGMAPPAVPGVQGPWGQAMPMAAPYSSAPTLGLRTAQAMMSHSVPLDMVQRGSGVTQASFNAPPGGAPPQILAPPGGLLAPPGMPFAPGMSPSGMPGGMPPGPGADIRQSNYLPGAVAAVGAMTNQVRFPCQRTQVRFTKPSGTKVSWQTQGADGKTTYSTPLEVPGHYNFLQAAIYQLKLSEIEGRPGMEVYPTLEVVPANYKTEAFLRHSSVQVSFTDEDFKQIAAGHYVVKVIYLPDPQYQELAGTGTEEILSTRLEPGADPINEALRRGSILVVIRMGNVDRESPNSPPLDAPNPNCPPPPPPGMGLPSNPMVPFGMKPPMGPGGPMLPPGGPMVPPRGPLAGPGPMMPPNMAGPGPMMPPPGFMAGPNGFRPGPGTNPFGPMRPNSAGGNPSGPMSLPGGPMMPQPAPVPGFNGPGFPPIPPNNAGPGAGRIPTFPPGPLGSPGFNGGPPPIPGGPRLP